MIEGIIGILIRTKWDDEHKGLDDQKRLNILCYYFMKKKVREIRRENMI